MPLRRAPKKDDQDDLLLGDDFDARVAVPSSADTIGGSLIDRIGDQVIEATRQELGETIDSLNAAASRFEELEGKLSEQTSLIETDEAHRNESFTKLEKRLGMVEESLRGEIDRSRRSADALDLIIDEVREKLETAASGQGNTDALSAELAELATRIEKAVSAVGETDANVSKLRAGIDEQLESVVEKVAATANEAPVAEPLDLDTALAPITDRLSSLADQVASLHTSLSERPDDSAATAQLVELLGDTKAAADTATTDIGKLRSSFDRRFDKLRNSISEMAPAPIEIEPALSPLNDQVSGLAAQLAALDERLSTSSPEPLDTSSITAPITEQLASLHERLETLQSSIPAAAEPLDVSTITTPITEQLSEGLKSLRDSIESSTTSADITQLTELVTKAISTVDETDANVAKLRAGLDARIESLHEAIAANAPTVDAEAITGPLGEQVATIHDQLVAAQSTSQSQLDVFSSNIGEVTAGLAALSASQNNGPDADEISAKVQQAVESAVQGITGIEVTARISDVLKRLDDFLGESRPATTAQVASDLKGGVDDLYEQVAQLSARLDSSWNASQQIPDSDDQTAVAERLGQVTVALDTSLRAGRDALETLRGSIDRVKGVVEKAAEDDPTFEPLAPKPDVALDAIAAKLNEVEASVNAAAVQVSAMERGEVTGPGSIASALRSIENLEGEMTASFGTLRRQISEVANVVYTTAEAAIEDPDDKLAEHLEKVRAAARQLVEAAETENATVPQG